MAKGPNPEATGSLFSCSYGSIARFLCLSIPWRRTFFPLKIVWPCASSQCPLATLAACQQVQQLLLLYCIYVGDMIKRQLRWLRCKLCWGGDRRVKCHELKPLQSRCCNLCYESAHVYTTTTSYNLSYPAHSLWLTARSSSIMIMIQLD